MADAPSSHYRAVSDLQSIVAMATLWDRSDGRSGRPPDFSGRSLRNADLHAVDLDEANFQGCDLRGANLSASYLLGADFTGADLRGARVSGTQLSGATLQDAKLDGASFRGADLSGARLERASFAPLALCELFEFNRELTFDVLRQASNSEAFFHFFGTDLDQVIGVVDRHGMGRFFDSLKKQTSEALDFLELLDRAYPDSVGHHIGADPEVPILIATDLRSINLTRAKITQSDFTRSWLSGADFTSAELNGVVFRRAKMETANLTGTSLQAVDLVEADLSRVRFIDTRFAGTSLQGSSVYGASVWGVVIGDDSNQERLVITPPGAPAIEVDDIEVAQFIYLLLNRQKLRRVIDAITSKAVLVLGRFTPERKVVLDGIADELRRHNLLPIIFDFERSEARDFTETIKILAGMSLFVIADITNPSSAPLELQATVPDYQIPFVPIIQEGEEPFAMFRDLLGKYDWVMQPVSYQSFAVLQRVFKEAVLDRAWEMHKELKRRKNLKVEALSAEDFLLPPPKRN